MPADAPRFDTALRAWVLSRFADVAAALRHPHLVLVGPQAETAPQPEAETARLEARAATQAALSPSVLADWQRQFESVTRDLADALPAGPIDLVSQVAQPGCLALASMVTGASADDCRRLADFARIVTASTADPENTALAERAAAAHQELDRYFPGDKPPRNASTFVALSQTLQSLMATSWYGLVCHPAEIARLAAAPELMPRAVEEMLRHASIANKVHRIALEDLELGGLRIARGERLILLLRSANHDAGQYTDPECLDLTRPAAVHLALGAGSHACVGAPLIRMAISIATQAWISRFDSADLQQSVDWQGGAAFRWPAALYITLRTNVRETRKTE